MMVTWHVDDLNLSHVEIIKVIRIITWLETQYSKMRFYRGKVHDYPGMELYYLVHGEVSARMGKYAEETVKAFPENITDSVVTSA